tara:strand:+ start:4101 stop:5846 length:1746 start_codon:yes stop_codon:yes gene_type:complete
MLEYFHLIRPWWLLALLPVVAIAILWSRRNSGQSKWTSAISEDLLKVLLEEGVSKTKRWFSSLVVGALILVTIGLSGPAWQKLPQAVEQKQDTLIILLDLSLSMFADDIKPSRVERARQKIADILRARKEGVTALVAYAGDGHAVVPLTDDTKTIENLLFSLSPEMMPVFGSNPNHALEIAYELFENAGILQGRILLITDGIDDISSVTRHRNISFPISILGIGTAQGAPIPLDRLRQPGRFLQTQEGNRVVALLDEERLQQVADISYGYYQTVNLGNQDINYVLSTKLPSEDKSIEVERKFDTWIDQGYWAAIILLPLLLAAFRKGVFVSLALCLVIPTGSIQASPLTNFWESIWLRDDQIALKALRQGEPEKAAALFKDEQWESVANYRSGEYENSLNGFRKNKTSDGLYNQGNALARIGQYEESIASYEQALISQPNDPDTLFNKALVEKLLEEKQQSNDQDGQNQEDQQSESSNDSQSSSSDEQQEKNQEENQSGDENQSKEEQKEAENKNSEQGTKPQQQEEDDESTRDEKKQALAQWLRRVPDDPGGLIRRKFQHETKQRLRRGEYENRQGDKVW